MTRRITNDSLDGLVDTDPIGLRDIAIRMLAALEGLRSCAHACGPAPCPHTRKYGQVTKGLIGFSRSQGVDDGDDGGYA